MTNSPQLATHKGRKGEREETVCKSRHLFSFQKYGMRLGKLASCASVHPHGVN